MLNPTVLLAGSVLLPLSTLLLAIGDATGTPSATSREAIDYMAHQPISWWFVALASIAITSWTFFGKWMIAQLGEQRRSNAELQSQLVAVLKEDHANAVTALGHVTGVVQQSNNVMVQTTEIMGRLLQKMSDQERVYLTDEVAARMARNKHQEKQLE